MEYLFGAVLGVLGFSIVLNPTIIATIHPVVSVIIGAFVALSGCMLFVTGRD